MSPSTVLKSPREDLPKVSEHSQRATLRLKAATVAGGLILHVGCPVAGEAEHTERDRRAHKMRRSSADARCACSGDLRRRAVT
jgi:hypothetical protein